MWTVKKAIAFLSFSNRRRLKVLGWNVFLSFIVKVVIFTRSVSEIVSRICYERYLPRSVDALGAVTLAMLCATWNTIFACVVGSQQVAQNIKSKNKKAPENLWDIFISGCQPWHFTLFQVARWKIAYLFSPRSGFSWKDNDWFTKYTKQVPFLKFFLSLF